MRLEKAVSTWQPGRHRDKHPLRPGYYRWDGLPARRTVKASLPEFFHRGRWHWVRDLAAFDHEAVRVTPTTFRKLLQHEKGRG